MTQPLRTFLLLLSVACGATASTAAAGPARPIVRALLHNEAKAEQSLVDSAKAEAVRLYALIDIDLIWVPHVTSPGTNLHVICLVNWEPDEKRLPSTALGYSPANPGHRGILAYVFVRRVERAAQRFTARVDNVLAVSMVHELGHMLLPDGTHAKAGLMRSDWDALDLRSASAGLLLFSSATADLIRRGQAQQTLTATGPTVSALPGR